MVLNLIPGVSILSDLGDILGDIGDISDIAEGTMEVSDSELEDLAIDSEDPRALTVSAASARSILGISTESKALWGLDELDSELLNTIVKNAIRGLMELMESPTPAERRETITHLTVKFREFNLEYYHREERGGASQRQNPSDSSEEE